ncbi:transcription initiation factor IID, 18kD subunit-domain-containing protein [Triangularia verruculosa]|uniref:Transcription initiation factor TFIID subunit 13 n=1 Tax=Triangularia verruculosa TaxID=2587418 RepID=A0AAN7AY81_9PEZI|nr:transcription initiation factor IID, 18kD subunit-domain-containing protein [Triangularia verruculosa]
MEPRARAGKNVGKMNFGHNELAQLLYSHGDARLPLNETVRVLDEVLTDFIQGVSFEATRAAHHAGRQKVKFEDFEFAMRRNPRFMGKIQEVFEKKKEIEAARKNFNIEDQWVKDAEREEKEKAAEREKEKGADKEDKARGKRGRPRKDRGASAGSGSQSQGQSVQPEGSGSQSQQVDRMDIGEEDLEDGLDDDLEGDADVVSAIRRR